MTLYKICLLPGDGIGPEIIAEGVKVLDAVGAKHGLAFTYEEAVIVGSIPTCVPCRYSTRWPGPPRSSLR